jgi:hypothetical protein
MKIQIGSQILHLQTRRAKQTWRIVLHPAQKNGLLTVKEKEKAKVKEWEKEKEKEKVSRQRRYIFIQPQGMLQRRAEAAPRSRPQDDIRYCMLDF